jgi:hypothetical protein
MSKHYVGEIGTAITINCGVDISDATTLQILYTKPSGVTGYWTGTLYNSNYIQYTLAANDLDVAGVWTVQANIVSPAWTGKGESVEFTVYPIVSEDLTTLAKVKSFLSIPSTNADHDELLNNIISGVSEEIEKYCGRVFKAQSHTEYIDGEGLDRFMVKNFPINSITSIHDDLDRVYGSDTLIASSDYGYDANTGIVFMVSSLFSEGTQNIKIVYNGGYATIPLDLENAAISLVVSEYLKYCGVINTTLGQDLGSRPYYMRKDAEKIINRYKRIR